MNCIITGISKGVGLEIAKKFLFSGWNVYGVCRTDTNDLLELKNSYSSNLFIKYFDISNLDEIQNEVFRNFVNNRIPIACLINNAAQAYDDIITNLNIENLISMYKVNTFAPMILTKYSIRNMIFNKVKGSIVHISSISSHTGYKGLAMYASTKGALEAFSKNTAREWGEVGIRSNVIVPGFMETSMSSDLSQEQKIRIYNRTSLKKATDIESVAETALFLSSEKSNSITGQQIFVDNGTI
jgi:3-oxoacyl-[acyl-carrier protein] reductase